MKENKADGKETETEGKRGERKRRGNEPIAITTA
jgi:hypothetical protein